MFTFFKPLVEIAFFKRGPEALPVNTAYSMFVVVLYVVSTAIAFMISKLPISQLLPSIVISLFAYALLSYGLLTLANKRERIGQTFTALVGADVVITLLILPAVFLLVNFPQESVEFQLGQLSYFLTLIWSVAVIAVILNAAMEWEMLLGFLIAPAFFFSLVLIGQLLFAAPVG